MEEFLKDDEFAQFIINDYLANSDMKIKEKLVVYTTETCSLRTIMFDYK